MPETMKQRLLRVLYPEVDSAIATMAAEGASWRQIAESVSATSGVTVSHESLRQWYGKSESAA